MGGQAAHAINVDLLSSGRQSSQRHVFDHASAQRRHRSLGRVCHRGPFFMETAGPFRPILPYSPRRYPRAPSAKPFVQPYSLRHPVRHRRQAVEQRNRVAVRRPAAVSYPGERRRLVPEGGHRRDRIQRVFGPEERQAVPHRDRGQFGTTATFASSQTDFAAGDVLKVVVPATADATLADIALTLAATLL